MASLLRSCLALVVLLGAAGIGRAATPVVTAVSSKISRTYKRAKLPDGSYKRELYVIANGRYAPGAARNESIDNVKFPQIAALVAQYLARKNYYLAPKAEDADFLLLVTWGTTIPFTDLNRTGNLSSLSSAAGDSKSAMNNLKSALAASNLPQGQGSTVGEAVRTAESEAFRANDALDSMLLQNQVSESARNRALEQDARLLGYFEEMDDRNDVSRLAGAGAGYDDLVIDLESARYYVIITALDFKTLVNENKQVPLWTTRVSIDSRRTRFDDALETMVASAGQRFGENSNGLERKPQEGSVTLGELKLLGVSHDAKSAEEPAAEKQK